MINSFRFIYNRVIDPEDSYNSVVGVTDCVTTSGNATTIVEESSIGVGSQLESTIGGSIANLPVGFYRLSNGLVNGQNYNLGDILITTYIVQVGNNGFITNINDC
jgi:hypothetical protein